MATDHAARDAASTAATARTARRLRELVEPIAAAVYFAPEAQRRYEGLGLNYFEGYFCSRSAVPRRGAVAGRVGARSPRSSPPSSSAP